MPSPRPRIELRVEPELLARIQRRAKHLGLSLSAFLRLAASTYSVGEAEPANSSPDTVSDDPPSPTLP